MLGKDQCEVMVPSKEERQFLIQLVCMIIIHNIFLQDVIIRSSYNLHGPHHAMYGGREAQLGIWSALIEAQKISKIRSVW